MLGVSLNSFGIALTRRGPWGRLWNRRSAGQVGVVVPNNRGGGVGTGSLRHAGASSGDRGSCNRRSDIVGVSVTSRSCVGQMSTPECGKSSRSVA